MSQIYNLEPPTAGQAIIHTTHGPLQIDLWSGESPTATKNFLQHALNGYYDNLPFHRVIPDVLVQTGDPTMTGTGGEAALGDPQGYPKELHGRLKFRRRGLMAMVCDNGLARSQFFITLSATEWLNGEHTIFGCVGGNTVYNLLNLGTNSVEGFDEGGPRVKFITIVENPFKELRKKETEKTIEKKEVAVGAKRAVRSRNLLSFADSDSDDEVVVPKRPRSRFANSKEEVKKVVKEEKEDKEAKEAMDELVKVEDDEIIRKANEEFARLKAQLDGDVNNIPSPKPKPSPKEARDDLRPNGKRKKKDEGEMLSRLKAFENKVMKSRKEARRDEQGRVRGAWFERGLRLGTQAMVDEEYEVHFGGRPNR